MTITTEEMKINEGKESTSDIDVYLSSYIYSFLHYYKISENKKINF